MTYICKKATPNVRRIFKTIEEVIASGQPATPNSVAQKAGRCYSAEIGGELTYLYQNGYVGKTKIGKAVHLSVLKSLPQEPK